MKQENKKRLIRSFQPGVEILAKNDRRNKTVRKYVKYKVKEDRGDTILRTTGKLIHKDNERLHSYQMNITILITPLSLSFNNTTHTASLNEKYFILVKEMMHSY